MEATCFISETVSDRVKRSEFYNSVGLLHTKLRFWVTWPLKVTWSQKRKLAIMSETVRDRAERSKFLNPVGLLLTELQLLKILIFGSHDPSRSPWKGKLAIISLKHSVGRPWRSSSNLNILDTPPKQSNWDSLSIYAKCHH